MPVRGAGNAVVNYNSVNITPYINSVELAATVQELEATDLVSTGSEYVPGLGEYTLSLGGDWIQALDNIFGPDVVAPIARAVTVKVTDEAGAWVQYAWTKGFLTGFSINVNASGKIEHTPSLRLSGAPTRTTGTV